MEHESPSQNSRPALRECTSCKRALPPSCYGILLSSKDGYNPTCKDCRRYFRNQTYHRGQYPGTIFPLMAQNLTCIERFDSKQLIGKSLSTKNDFKVLLTVKPGQLKKMEIRDANDNPTDIYYCASEKIVPFLNFVAKFLTKKRIRLLGEPDNFLF